MWKQVLLCADKPQLVPDVNASINSPLTGAAQLWPLHWCFSSDTLLHVSCSCQYLSKTSEHYPADLAKTLLYAAACGCVFCSWSVVIGTAMAVGWLSMMRLVDLGSGPSTLHFYKFCTAQTA